MVIESIFNRDGLFGRLIERAKDGLNDAVEGAQLVADLASKEGIAVLSVGKGVEAAIEAMNAEPALARIDNGPTQKR